MEEKKPWSSKTMWVNLLVAVSAMIPYGPIQELLTEANLVMILSVVNMVLRLVSKDKIGLN
tara:strand:- start:3199 stop:3381 length:183 start_codon:yes stop_codon:yes gene_type:complete